MQHLIFIDWVFDVPPIYNECDLRPEECDAIGAVKVKDFDHSVDAPNSITVTCEPGEREDGLPDWTWYAEGYKFHRPIPRLVTYYISWGKFARNPISEKSISK